MALSEGNCAVRFPRIKTSNNENSRGKETTMGKLHIEHSHFSDIFICTDSMNIYNHADMILPHRQRIKTSTVTATATRVQVSVYSVKQRMV